LKIKETDTVASLERKVHQIEHKLYPQAVSLYIEDRLKIEGRRVRIINR